MQQDMQCHLLHSDKSVCNHAAACLDVSQQGQADEAQEHWGEGEDEDAVQQPLVDDLRNLLYLPSCGSPLFPWGRRAPLGGARLQY